jgi:hypothetical protein
MGLNSSKENQTENRRKLLKWQLRAKKAFKTVATGFSVVAISASPKVFLPHALMLSANTPTNERQIHRGLLPTSGVRGAQPPAHLIFAEQLSPRDTRNPRRVRGSGLATPAGYSTAMPKWTDLPADTSAALRDAGVDCHTYDHLLQGEVVSQSRPDLPGKPGVHEAVFGLVPGSLDKLWSLLLNCGESTPIMPHVTSCRLVQPDHPLPRDKRWEQLQIDFRLLFFSIKTTMINEQTIKEPNYLKWRQVQGEARRNEGYFRIITLAPRLQFVEYNVLVDTGPLVPQFVKAWAIRNTLPKVITALRDHIQS